MIIKKQIDIIINNFREYYQINDIKIRKQEFKMIDFDDIVFFFIMSIYFKQ